MSEPADFAAYRRLRLAAEGAEALLLRLRSHAERLLHPDADQSQAAFAELIGELESAPEFDQLRRALGHPPLPPMIEVEPGE